MSQFKNRTPIVRQLLATLAKPFRYMEIEAFGGGIGLALSKGITKE